ncbi:CapA family protein [Pseudarthrobacter sp. DSP2-3-2b1]|uniref:CapA family protein n=1 Tax=Pseudarthrobacter sp. DSP2-3-2b1 TaxID=2804661 RepID=UPI003CF01C16
MSAAAYTILAVGDLVLDEEEVGHYFDPTREIIQAADLAIAQIEVPHTTSTECASVDIPAPPAPVQNVAEIARAGFTVATLAGNHIYDCGPQGIADTIGLANAAGMQTTGAGADLDAAKVPVITQLGPLRVGLLNYNCVGPRESWATSKKAGCAFVNVLTHYELDSANPGGPPSVYSFAEPKSLEAFTADVRALAAEVDVVIVALHKGVVHLPADIAAYETQLAHAAIDNGAHAVIAHHAHIMRGIEFYRGAPVFHGLGNFVTVTNALNVSGDNSPERLAWAKRRKKLFGFESDATMPNYAFHPESRNTAMALMELDEDGGLSASFIPCWIDQSAAPRPLSDEASAAPVLAYVEAISREAGFDTHFTWDTDRVRVSAPA